MEIVDVNIRYDERYKLINRNKKRSYPEKPLKSRGGNNRYDTSIRNKYTATIGKQRL
jgi:hypothetical protein